MAESHEERQERLKALFALVENRKNWKNPINRFVPEDADLDGIKEAVRHFTGCVPTFTRVHRRKNKRSTWGYQVTAPGYYIAIGS
jgi:hypothetical protein